VLVGGGVGWVVGSGSGHNPGSRRQPSGHALIPGAAAAVAVDLEALRPEWVRSCFFEGHGTGLMIPIAAPVPCAPAHSPRLAAAAAHELVAQLIDGRFPLQVPLRPLSDRAGWIPLET
jgi:uncharacterized protein (DUF39 family)